MSAPSGCLDCIGGMALSDSPVLGTCFRVCLACQPCCPCCSGQGAYPAWTRDMNEFIATYNDNGLVPVLCHTCGGVVDVVSLPEENTP